MVSEYTREELDNLVFIYDPLKTIEKDESVGNLPCDDRFKRHVWGLEGVLFIHDLFACNCGLMRLRVENGELKRAEYVSENQVIH